ncbi:hypothetical protein LWN17_004723 [Salmonella enterica]|nr:hypothetical protein [Salmonella enterica]
MEISVMRGKLLFLLVISLLISFTGRAAGEHKIRMIIDGHVIHGSLDNSRVAGEIFSMLPFSLSPLTELGGREKYGNLPDSVKSRGQYTDQYSPGMIGYWSPGNQLAFYYHDDGQRIPSPGIIPVGTFDSSTFSLLKDATIIRIEQDSTSGDNSYHE